MNGFQNFVVLALMSASPFAMADGALSTFSYTGPTAPAAPPLYGGGQFQGIAQVYGVNGNTAVPGALIGSWTDPTGFVTVDLSRGPIPSLSVSANSAPAIPNVQAAPIGYYSDIYSAYSYGISVEGPDMSIDVPIDFVGKYQVHTALVADVPNQGAGVVGSYGDWTFNAGVDGPAGCTNCSGTFFGTSKYEAGALLTITASAYVLYGANATANIDPYVYIDPTWAAAHPGYTLTVEPGVGNDPIPSVPEPHSLWLSVCGAAVVFGVRIRKLRLSN